MILIYITNWRIVVLCFLISLFFQTWVWLVEADRAGLCYSDWLDVIGPAGGGARAESCSAACRSAGERRSTAAGQGSALTSVLHICIPASSESPCRCTSLSFWWIFPPLLCSCVHWLTVTRGASAVSTGSYGSSTGSYVTLTSWQPSSWGPWPSSWELSTTRWSCCKHRCTKHTQNSKQQ